MANFGTFSEQQAVKTRRLTVLVGSAEPYHCEILKLTQSKRACGAMHAAAKLSASASPCRDCNVGAAHAAGKPTPQRITGSKQRDRGETKRFGPRKCRRCKGEWYATKDQRLWRTCPKCKPNGPPSSDPGETVRQVIALLRRAGFEPLVLPVPNGAVIYAPNR